LVIALGRIGAAAGEAIPVLEREYQDGTNRLRFAAAAARLRIDGNGPEAAALLAAGLGQPEGKAREAVLEEVGWLSETRGEAIPLLLQAIKDPEANIRAQAIRSLGSMGKRAASAGPALCGLVADSSMSVRVEAAEALKAITSSPSAK
jgi:HEAT repeat protein